MIVNADALQVFGGWHILTARPSPEEEQLVPHALYGHVPFDAPYSTGHWLRDVAPFLSGSVRPIIVGGTGLNFSALTEGLADIPATPPDVRSKADQLSLEELLAGLDGQTKSRIDTKNRVRAQRAWEVLRTTGRSISDWQDNTPPALLPISAAVPLVLTPDTDWLNDRIERRFDQMLNLGALEEAKTMLPLWNPSHLSSRAIGAPELISHLQGHMSLSSARDAAVVASRRYAKRQRTWFRSRMTDWVKIPQLSTG